MSSVNLLYFISKTEKMMIQRKMREKDQMITEEGKQYMEISLLLLSHLVWVEFLSREATTTKPHD